MIVLLQAVSLFGFASADWAAVLAAVLLFGAVDGMITLQRAFLVARWCGQHGFGARSGRVLPVTTIAWAVSPFAIETLRGVANSSTTFVLLGLVFLSGTFAAVIAVRHLGPRGAVARALSARHRDSGWRLLPR